MSDPKIWNGTAWVRPRFWDGTSWLEYRPPEYDVPLSWGMDSVADCPPGYYGDWNPAGYITRNNIGGGGLLSGVNVGASTQYAPDATVDIEYAIGHTVRAEAGYSWVPNHASSAAPNTFRFTAGLSGVEDGAGQGSLPTFEASYDLADPRLGWTVQTGPAVIIPMTYPGWPRSWSFDVNQNTADFSEPYTNGEIRCDWFRFWNVTTGQPLMSLGDPGWEPKVWTGSQWR